MVRNLSLRRQQRPREPMRIQRSTVLWATVLLGGAILLLLVINPLAVILAPGQVDAEQATIIHNTRTSLIQLLGFSIIAGSLVFTAQSYRLNKMSYWNATFCSTIANISDQQSMGVRIGGFYSMQMLLGEQPRLQTQIEAIIGEFIREKAKAGAQTPRDVQVALEVLGSVEEGSRDRNNGRIDLSNIYLENVRLSNLNLERVSLRDAVMHNVDLEHTRMVDADMAHATLTQVNLSNCNLQASRLDYLVANKEVDVSGAKLQGASIQDASMSGVIGLTEKQLEGLIGEAKNLPD